LEDMVKHSSKIKYIWLLTYWYQFVIIVSTNGKTYKQHGY
jgi:hypothetical protein